jgi:AcrR family transcriptional regulator
MTTSVAKLPAVTSGQTAYHHGSLRASLLQQAERTIAERGADGLSLRELARAAGVSHSAPSRHFSSRQALLDALAVTGFQRLGRQLEVAMQPGDGTFARRLTAFAQAYVRFATRHPALLDLMFTCLHRSGASHEVREANDQAFAATIELIALARARGDIVGDDPSQVATAILATVQGIAAIAGGAMLTGQKPVDAVVCDTIAILINGLRPREPHRAQERGRISGN